MDTPVVRSRIDGPVSRIAIDRPDKRNALSDEVVAALGRAFARSEADRNVRVVVLSSAGDRAFSAGADLSGIVDREEGEPLPGIGRYVELLRFMRRMRPIIVARVQGPAVGGGLGLVLASDIVVASRAARFATPEARIGLFPMIILAPLVRHLPPKILSGMVFAGDVLAAERAARWGLVTDVVDPEDLDRTVGERVASILESSPDALVLGRRALHAVGDLPYDASLDYLREMLDALGRSEDLQEGIEAFLEKRSPTWQERG